MKEDGIYVSLEEIMIGPFSMVSMSTSERAWLVMNVRRR